MGNEIGNERLIRETTAHFPETVSETGKTARSPEMGSSPREIAPKWPSFVRSHLGNEISVFGNGLGNEIGDRGVYSGNAILIFPRRAWKREEPKKRPLVSQDVSYYDIYFIHS